MRRRQVLQSLLTPMVAAGCTAPVVNPVDLTHPPAGTPTAGAAFPPVGTRWRVRVTDRGLLHQTVDDRDVRAANVEFGSRRGYGLIGASVVTVLDPATFNRIGTIEGGNIAITQSPDSGLFSWPLWVGKAWEGNTNYADRSYGVVWPEALYRSRVTAMEDVTVPAGTFRTFRIEYHGGIGTTNLSGGWSNPGGPGYESRDIVWYAPGPKMIVKSQMDRIGTHYRWDGRTTTELLTTPA